MDMTTLLIIVVIVLLLGGGGFYGRGRWWSTPARWARKRNPHIRPRCYPVSTTGSVVTLLRRGLRTPSSMVGAPHNSLVFHVLREAARPLIKSGHTAARVARLSA